MSRLRPLLNNHLFMSAFYKAISGLSLFVSIPILISYLGSTIYGVWVLVFTLFQWVLMMDFGLSSVLKTKIPELQHSGNVNLISAYIKAAYVGCCYIAVAIFFLFCAVVIFFDIQSVLNIPFESTFVDKLFLLNLFFFCVNFILNTHKGLYVGVHRGKFAEQSIAVNQIVFLLFLMIPLLFLPSLKEESKLYLISCINGIIFFVINFLYTLYFFITEKISLFNTVKLPKNNLNEIYRLGFKYMVIQVFTFFLFASDNYILAYFFGPNEVVPYDITTKYFHFPLMILMAGMAPLWSSFSKNHLEKNTEWLKMSFKKFNYFYILILIGMLLCAVIAPAIMKIWISDDFSVPPFLIITVAVLTSLRIYTTFYSYFFNGIGNLRSTLLLLMISVVLKIPLAYLFIKLDFGISSVVLSSAVCLAIWIIVQPVEAYKIVANLKKNE